MLSKSLSGFSTNSFDLRASGASFDDEESVDLGPGATRETTVDEALKEVQALARNETQGVRFWKVVVLLIMCTIAALVSAGTYVFLKAEEDDDYIESYYLFARSMQTAIEEHSNSIFLAMRSGSKFITSDAIARGNSFPFHTVANFEVMGESLRKQSGLELFAYVPYVHPEDELKWMQYSNTEQGWVETSRQSAIDSGEANAVNNQYLEGSITPVIYDFGGPNATARKVPPGPEPFTPVWQISPPPFDPKTVNFNFRFYEFLATAIPVMEKTRRGHFTRILASGELGRLARTGVSSDDHDKFHKQFVDWDESKGDAFLNPHGAYVEPVFKETHNRNSDIVGYMVAFVPWDAYIANLLPDGVDGVTVVIDNSCGQSATYEVRGKRARFLDRMDLHDSNYDDTEVVVSFDVLGHLQADAVEDECIHTFHIYSSSAFEESYRSTLPATLTAVVAGAFLFLIASFFVYDWFQTQRNHKVIHLAARQSEIVASLFPTQVRGRLIAERETKKKSPPSSMFRGTEDQRLQRFLSERGVMADEDSDDFMFGSKPIADLYPDTTIMFADIAGFTAWSTSRQPSQVFVLLETLYKNFDQIANRRRVFKVETIGDCYVACAGLPEPMADHALVMCRFANECLRKFRSLTRKLETVLGPDTANLGLRCGLHSGSVTAGVLRGERSRFQLFGDSMNTASRMESTGERGKIHVSQETADSLIAGGKGHWLKPREGKVKAKGLGELNTYWVKPSSSTQSRKALSDMNSEHSGNKLMESGRWEDGSESDPDPDLRFDNGAITMERTEPDSAMARLVQWNVDIMLKILKEIAKWKSFEPVSHLMSKEEAFQDEHVTFDFNDNIDTVTEELELFIFSIATMHQNHPFHNFSHASNVAMNVMKLLSSLVPHGDVNVSSSSLPAFDPSMSNAPERKGPAHCLHSNPSSRLACVLAALIHAVENAGVSNAVRMSEDSNLAQVYRRNISEHLSFESCWQLLHEDKFKNLCSSIFRTPAERAIFREQLLHCVLATDVADEESNAARKQRWDSTFVETPSVEEAAEDLNERRALLLMEYVVQASSVAHAMQHWEVYQKNCNNSFDELYKAYSDDRTKENPGETWFQKELELFDTCVIPLAVRLCESGAFQKATIDTYLSYAQKNRREWEEEGHGIVMNFTERAALAKIRAGDNVSSHGSLQGSSSSLMVS